jgi:hypothetical protein
MNALGTLVSAIADSFMPDGTTARLRFRASLETILAFLIALLAVALTVGYQVFRRWARRTEGGD